MIFKYLNGVLEYSGHVVIRNIYYYQIVCCNGDLKNTHKGKNNNFNMYIKNKVKYIYSKIKKY